ncbi:bifunctional folylpolyglutamate synthase/dihydrofolate synthase, partial [Flavobacterium sp.]|uniref:bifunctional folylpolyglutamate synthase/dihydrofolate synthase n=1 Tax=Flavobacterium sp. TaxID=239 RepID=UPI003C505EB8
YFEANDISFFEMSVGLAFDYFNTEKVDLAIIEVGMGGRLDATNIINPLLSVITNIGLDHVQFLGNTLELVAAEKAGIIKEKTPVVIGEYTADTKAVFLAKAKEKQADIYFAADLITEIFPSDLLGDYQVFNTKTVLQSIEVLNSQNDITVSKKQIRNGLLNVTKNTNLQGRWQQLGNSPKIICDTAHNKEGLNIVFNQIKKEEFKTLHIVFGVVNDKNLDAILPLLPKNAIYYFSKPNNPRGLDVQILFGKATNIGLIGKSFNSITEAYTEAKNQAKNNDFIYIGGSTFVVAEIL